MTNKGTKPHLRTDAAAMKRAPTVPKWLPHLLERRIIQVMERLVPD
ncbi:phage terminase, small subunit, putative, P27 [Nitrobacter sp. Nb-311A]|nr:phage terminase, small subunit, putative, P27 [Nitrobacter sp. Nb-311A]